jgi:hypothetical protein
MSMPAYNGADNADDTLVSAWNTPGWTAQSIAADTIQTTPGLFSAAPFPTDIIFAQLVAPYFDFDGNPLSGFLTFMMSEGITITNVGKAYRIPARYAGRDNSMTPGGLMNWGTGRIYIRNGTASVTIMCTQQTGLVTDSGSPLTYHVTEHFLGGQQYDIIVPSNTVSPDDIRSLIVSGSVQPYNYDPADPTANEGYTPLVPSLSVNNDIDGGGA